jgi:hypothetical protein
LCWSFFIQIWSATKRQQAWMLLWWSRTRVPADNSVQPPIWFFKNFFQRRQQSKNALFLLTREKEVKNKMHLGEVWELKLALTMIKSVKMWMWILIIPEVLEGMSKWCLTWSCDIHFKGSIFYIHKGDGDFLFVFKWQMELFGTVKILSDPNSQSC